MPAYRLTVEYDGTDFHGWQAQPSARTVAGTLAAALSTVSGDTVRVAGAGRTDAGAHAHGQVAGVTLRRAWETLRLQAALNAVLPNDVTVSAVTRAADDFDARRDALSRTYRYVVLCRDQRAPVTRRHAWTVRGPLDVDAMRRAASAFAGTHDFGELGASPTAGGSTVRTVQMVSIDQLTAGDGPAYDVVVITVRANAFLRGMMRAIAGVLVAIGQGRRSESWAAELVDTDTVRAPHLPLAPAHGLHQWSVEYGAAA